MERSRLWGRLITLRLNLWVAGDVAPVVTCGRWGVYSMRFALDKNRLKAILLEKSSRTSWKNNRGSCRKGTPSGWPSWWGVFWTKMRRNGREYNGFWSRRKCSASSLLWGQFTSSMRSWTTHPLVLRLPSTSKGNASHLISNFSPSHSKLPEEKNP